jgi:hypothetical protein
MKTMPVGVRLEPEVKDALERAAKADMRKVSTMASKILTEWLKDNGYLK